MLTFVVKGLIKHATLASTCYLCYISVLCLASLEMEAHVMGQRFLSPIACLP